MVAGAAIVLTLIVRRVPLPAVRPLIVAFLVCAAPVHAQSAGLSGTEGRVPAPASADWARIVGSYEIRVCAHGPCDQYAESERERTVFVSIEQDAITLQGIDDDTRLMLFIGSTSATRPRNACYALVKRAGRSAPRAGPGDVGVFSVRPYRDSAGVTLVLGGSVDSFYRVSASIVDGWVEGTGQEYGLAGSVTQTRPDTIIGRRMGPPNAARCIELAHYLGIEARRDAQKSDP